MGFVRITPSGQQGMPDGVEQVDTGEVLPTAEIVADEARRLKQESREAPVRMFGALEATPTGTEVPMLSAETMARLQQEQDEKASVANVVTTHADIAKMASPADGVYLTSSSAAYSQPAEDHEDCLEVDDKTVFPNNTTDLARPLTDLERAESSIPQPKGDEVSSLSATGPYLPTGVAGAQVRDGDMKEMAHDPGDSTREMQAAHRDEVLEAGKAAVENAGAEGGLDDEADNEDRSDVEAKEQLLSTDVSPRSASTGRFGKSVPGAARISKPKVKRGAAKSAARKKG